MKAIIVFYTVLSKSKGDKNSCFLKKEKKKKMYSMCPLPWYSQISFTLAIFLLVQYCHGLTVSLLSCTAIYVNIFFIFIKGKYTSSTCASSMALPLRQG